MVLVPNLSESHPESGMNKASVSAYVTITECISVAEISISRAMEGSEVFKMVPSKDCMNMAIAVTHGKRFVAVASFLSCIVSCIDILNIRFDLHKLYMTNNF